MYILNTKVENLPKPEVLEKIRQLLVSEEKGKQLATTNPEFILATQKDEKFREIINSSWLSVPDGYGLRLAAKYLQLTRDKRQETRDKIRSFFIFFFFFFLGLKVAVWGILKKDKKLDIIKETITGTDLIPDIAKICFENNKKIFLLGGFGDTPKLVAENLKKNVIPSEAMRSLQIDYSVFETDNIIEKINSFAPDVLFVAIGHPRAQIWIDENLPKMPNVKLAIGVGGAFDYWAGKIKRAPEKWQGSFEWVYRLLHQPKRLKRIWQASIVFPWRVFTASLK